jgi:signal transduction histidine kinase
VRIITFAVSALLLLFISAARRRAEVALRRANAELAKRATARLVRTKRRARERVMQARFEARLEERTRLAREIHDTLLQGFTGVSLQLLATMGRVDIARDCRAALTGVLALAQKTLTDARRAVWDMRPAPLEGDDFVASLREALDLSLSGSTLVLDFIARGVPRALEREVETVIFRVAQEAVTNVVRHAAASSVRVLLSFGPRSVGLVVADDGRGFVVAPDLQTYAGRWGLLGMRERASQLRAKLSVRSIPGAGTKVVLRVPSRASSALPD